MLRAATCMAVTCMAVTSLARSFFRLGRTMPREATTSVFARIGTATEQAPRLISSTVVVAYPGQLAAQGARLADRVRRDPDKVREYLGLDRRGRVREQDLADPGGVHRQTRTDRAHHRYGCVPREPIQVEHLGPVADGQMHGGQRCAVQVVEVGGRQLAKACVHRGEQADVPEATTDDVLPRRCAAQRSPGDELGDQPMGGRHG